MSVCGVLQSVGVRGLLVWLAVMATLHSKSSQLASQTARPAHSSAGGRTQCGGLARGDIALRNSTVAETFISINGSEWRVVCDDGWDMDDAVVACRQLGYAEGETTRAP